MKKPVVYKENKKKQRPDVKLNKEIAIALTKKVFSGKPIFLDSSYRVTIELPQEDGTIKTVELARSTVNAWISRENIIPETGETLRELLDRAREEYKKRKREEEQREMLELAQTKMKRVMNLRTKDPVRNIFGEVIKNEDGSVARIENHNVLRIQMDVAKFVSERLDPTYMRKESADHRVAVFSLAELRRHKEEIEKDKE